MSVIINKISNKVSVNTDTFEKDFDVIKIVKDKKDMSLNIYNLCGNYNKYIKAIFYESKKYVSAYVLLEKGKVSLEKLKDKFSSHENIMVSSEQSIPLSVFLNLLLLNESDKLCDGERYVINNNFYYIVETGKDIVVTLLVRFIEKNDGIYLENKVITFSRYSKLSDYDKKKKNVYFLMGGKTLKRIYDIENINEEDIYVQKNIYSGKKNTVDSLLFDLKIYDSKLGIVGKLYKIFTNNYKYINDFSFDKINMNLYKNKQLFKSYEYTKGQNCIINHINKNILTIVGNNITRDDINKEIVDKFSFNISNQPGPGLNLVVLNSNKFGEDEESDKKYQDDKSSNIIIQHVGKDTLNKKEALIKCMQELIIKSDLKNRYISYFDWNNYKPLNKEYSFYIKTLQEDEKILHHSITINTNGDILDIKINKEESFDDVFDSLDVKHLGAIKDSDNNIIILKNDDGCFVLPDFENFLKDIDQYIEGVKYPFTGHIWYNILNQISKDMPNLKNEIDDLFLENDEIYEYSEETLSFNNFKIKVNDKGKKVLSRTLKNKINDRLKDKYQLSIVGAFKGEEYLDEKYTGVLGINYNQDNFVVGSTSHYMGQKLNNNINMRKIEVISGENFFEELLDMFYVPFVKNTFLTILPFPFKYLREAINNPGLV